MDYSLQNLNKNLKLNDLKVSDFVEKLNLIGLEVDNLSSEKMLTNSFLDNITVLLKIPANREDLLNESFFLKEIATIFLVEIYQSWEKLKQSYYFLLQRKYNQSTSYSRFIIPSNIQDVVKYIIEIENAEIKASPLWIINKLKMFGLKSSNNITDILNLVFSEWGQTINLFLTESNVSQLSANFRLECLINEELYIDTENKSTCLYPGTIVLKEANSNKILSVLGIFQSNFQVQENQKSICFLLEATFYDIHLNPLLLNTINTKISLKTLRRACLQNFKFSFQRILTLLELLTCCKILPKKFYIPSNTKKLETIKILSLKKKNLLNFLNINKPEPILFKTAGLSIICETNQEYFFSIPTYRHDLSREIDLIEEYSRFIGYKNFQEILPTKDVSYTKSLFRQKYFIKNFFLNIGFYEVITNPIGDAINQQDSSIVINNPLNTELSTLRRSLIPKILDVFELNSRSSYPQTNFFEIGRTFKQVERKIVEQDKLAGIFQLPIQTNNKNSYSDWFIAKGIIENFLKNFGYKKIDSRKILSNNEFFHSTRSVIFSSENQILGIFGEMNPILRKEKYSHLRRPIYLFELNVNYFHTWKLTSTIKVIQEYSKYPLIVKDLSVLVPKDFDINKLKLSILSEFKFLKKVTVFDIYFDEKFETKVNLGIRLEFQSSNETLTNEQVEVEMETIKKFVDQEIILFSSSVS